jgi:hypothetical protein
LSTKSHFGKMAYKNWVYVYYCRDIEHNIWDDLIEISDRFVAKVHFFTGDTASTNMSVIILCRLV